MSGTDSSKANAAQAAIVHRFVHDLKNKIGGLSLLADMFDEQDPDTQQQILEQIKMSSLNALRLSETLMDDLKIERTLELSRVGRVDLSELVQESLDFYRQQAEEKNISVRVEIEQEIFVRGQRSHLRTIPMELIGNAVKFCRSGDTITVKFGRGDEGCRLEVTDDGPGLDPADQDALFQRYMQLSNTPTNGESSSKRGLADALLVAKAHQASIKVTSGGKGCGSSFVFEIEPA